MNGKACKGLIVTQAAMEAYVSTGESSNVDPDNLRVDKDADWMAMVEADPSLASMGRTTEADAVAACRAWYDWKKYDAPFCCQMTL
jgi:hypothetical protein